MEQTKWGEAPKWRCPSCRRWVREAITIRCRRCLAAPAAYHQGAVENAIRADPSIGPREAAAIHRLLRGRE